MGRNTHKPPRRRVSIAEAADCLGISEKTIRRRIADGSLTADRVGPRLIRVDLDEVERLAKPIPAVGGGDAA